MTETTAADRAKAAERDVALRITAPIRRQLSFADEDELVRLVSLALAGTRAEARAPYDRLTADLWTLAEEWEREGCGLQASGGHGHWVQGQRALDDAARLRAVAAGAEASC